MEASAAVIAAPEQPADEIAQPIASVRGLEVSLARGGQRSQVLHGIDLDISAREIVAIVGESGSGKSVTSLTLMGLLPPRSKPQINGSATVAGVDMTSASDAEKRRVRQSAMGVVFQDPMTSLNPTMRVGQQIVEAAGTKERAIELMRKVGIPQPEVRFSAYPHELSGGLRQRIMISMAIAHDPQLIIADEPTTALDVTVQAQVLRVLGDLRDELGCSVILITHDLGVAAQIADRIVVMQHGRIVESGATERVLSAPEHDYTRRLLRSRLDLSTDRNRLIPVGDADAESTQDDVLDRSIVADETLVKITELECRFPVRDQQGKKVDLQALRGVTTDVGEGECVALVGESGSGKSTLLRSIAGLETRWKGHLEMPDDTDIQMAFQDAGASLTPWLTVEEMLSERLQSAKVPRGERRERVAATLELMGLPESTLAARPSELSGGQRQRVALARATIIPPKVLLCDEPTSALDVSLAAVVLNLIQRLRTEFGITVVFVTHDLAVARFISDRVAVMYLGRLVEVGPTEEVINHPRHPYTKALVDAIPGMESQIVTVRGEPASPLSPPSGCAYHPRCPLAIEECSHTLKGIQLIPLRSHGSSLHGEANRKNPLDQHEVACVHVQAQVTR